MCFLASRGQTQQLLKPKSRVGAAIVSGMPPRLHFWNGCNPHVIGGFGRLGRRVIRIPRGLSGYKDALFAPYIAPDQIRIVSADAYE